MKAPLLAIAAAVALAASTAAAEKPIAYTSAITVNAFHRTGANREQQATGPMAAQVRLNVAAVPGAVTYAASLHCPGNVAGAQDETLTRSGVAAGAETTFALAVATHKRAGVEVETQTCWLKVAIAGVDVEDVDTYWRPVLITHRRAHRY